MNPKTTIGLVVALIIALAAVWWAQSSSVETEEVVAAGPKPLFDPPIGEVIAFEVVQTASGQPMKFELGEDKKWRMTAPLSGPAEQFMITTDTGKVAQLEFVKSYPPDDSDRPTDEMTSLKNPTRIVKLTERDGKVHVVKIGASQMLSSNTYVQKEGDEIIYLVNADLNKDLKHRLTDYRGKRVAEFPQNDAIRIESSGAEHYVLVKSGMKWTVEQPQKARADAGKVSSLLSTLSSLNAEQYIDDKPVSLRPYGLENPRFAISVTTETKVPKSPPEPLTSAPAEPDFEIKSATTRLLIGAEAEDRVFAKVDDPASSAVFEISKAAAKQIMQSLDDLRDRKIVDIGAARVQKLVLGGASGPVELASIDNVWQITAGLPGDGPQPAEFAAVDEVIKTLKNLTATGFESQQLPEHGLDAPRASVEVMFEGTVEPIRVLIGANTPSDTGAYVKNERENLVAVVKADQVNPFLGSAASFMNRDLLRMSPQQIARLEFDHSGRQYVLAKQEGAWKFVEPIPANADSQAVANIVNDVSMLRGQKVVALAADAAKYGLDRPVVTVAITEQVLPPATTQPDQADPNPPAPIVHRLRIGRSAERAFALVEGGRVICEIDPKVLDDLTAETLDRDVLSFDPSTVSRVRFTGANAMTFDRDGDVWRLEGESTFPVDPQKLTELLTALNDLKAERYVVYSGAILGDYGLESPDSAVTIETGDGQSMTLMISARGESEADRFAAVAAQAGRVFLVSSENAARFLKRVADFQKQG